MIPKCCHRLGATSYFKNRNLQVWFFTRDFLITDRNHDPAMRDVDIDGHDHMLGRTQVTAA